LCPFSHGLLPVDSNPSVSNGPGSTSGSAAKHAGYAGGPIGVNAQRE